MNVTPTNVKVSLIDKPKDLSIIVSLDRVTPCYSELGDCSWNGRKKVKSSPKSVPRTLTILSQTILRLRSMMVTAQLQGL